MGHKNKARFIKQVAKYMLEQPLTIKAQRGYNPKVNFPMQHETYPPKASGIEQANEPTWQEFQ